MISWLPFRGPNPVLVSTAVGHTRRVVVWRSIFRAGGRRSGRWKQPRRFANAGRLPGGFSLLRRGELIRLGQQLLDPPVELLWRERQGLQLGEPATGIELPEFPGLPGQGFEPALVLEGHRARLLARSAAVLSGSTPRRVKLGGS